MGGVIQTNPARCRDCYSCVRACPVKAVQVLEAQGTRAGARLGRTLG